MMNAVAFLRSGLTRISLTVTGVSMSTGSRRCPSAITCTSAWRSSSPTLNWRWLAAPADLRVMSDVPPPRHRLAGVDEQMARRFDGRLERARDRFDFEALDHVAGADVLVVLEGH